MSAQSQVQQTLDAATSAQNGVPGIVFGMMDKQGNWLAKAASGVKSLDHPDKMETDTVFAIYSCTKVGLDTKWRHLDPVNPTLLQWHT